MRAPRRTCARLENDGSPRRDASEVRPPAGPPLHRIRGFVAAEGTDAVGLELALRRASVLLAELHADAGSTLACAHRRSDFESSPQQFGREVVPAALGAMGRRRKH
jgi:hypothetical protein